jgi:hypothetical protein
MWPARTALRITPNFAVNPAVGGIPVNDSKKRNISAAVPGAVAARPWYPTRFSPRSPSPMTTPKAPRVIKEYTKAYVIVAETPSGVPGMRPRRAYPACVMDE